MFAGSGSSVPLWGAETDAEHLCLEGVVTEVAARYHLIAPGM
jgi:hypothetical protein